MLHTLIALVAVVTLSVGYGLAASLAGLRPPTWTSVLASAVFAALGVALADLLTR